MMRDKSDTSPPVFIMMTENEVGERMQHVFQGRFMDNANPQ